MTLLLLDWTAATLSLGDSIVKDSKKLRALSENFVQGPN
jgi:hypothetical protein